MASTLETIAPGFLIAAPTLQDPNFEKSVVLMCIHNEDGAMGLIINRPSPLSLSDIMEQLNLDHTSDLSQAAMLGGPVALENGMILYEAGSPSEIRDDELQVSELLRLCPNKEVLISIGNGIGPAHYHMFLGHAGWGPGQLEQEIAEGVWLPAPMRTDLIFSVPYENRWEAALKSEGLNAFSFSASHVKA